MIRKFKHTQTGATATNEGCLKGYYKVNLTGTRCQEVISGVYIENTCDWKEIQQPKYQILSFQHPENGNVYKLLPTGCYGYIKNQEVHLSIAYEECLIHYSIHSVKRLSDGVIFKLKDTITSRCSIYKQVIDKFTLFGDDIACYYSQVYCPLDMINLAPTPPLTATVTVTYSDKRPKQTLTLNRGEQAFIHF